MAEPSPPTPPSLLPVALTLFALATGAVYAVLTLIAGIGAFFWLLVLLILTRRLALRALWPLPVLSFVVGFALAFFLLLIPAALSCQAPSCYTTPWDQDLVYAGIDLLVAAVVFSLSRLGLSLRRRLLKSS